MSGMQIVYTGSVTGEIKQERRTIRALANNEVLVAITHSGVCGTDEHYKHQNMVLGHEGVGKVVDVGSHVSRFQIGDRVGWGYSNGSCGDCWACSTGQNLYCDERKLYGSHDLDQGSFASHAIRDQAILFHLPNSISLAQAAPLMCAGAAVYSALERAACHPSHRVGVLGIGGLGHLAIQFAAKMGCEVVAFSSSSNKKAEAMAYGAHEFRDMKSHAPASTKDSVDILLVTTASQPDWRAVIRWIKRGGTISMMTVDSGELRLPYIEVLMNAIQIQGSLPAPYQLHREMLEFATRHDIRPTIELFALDERGIVAAMEKLRRGDVRYRVVLETK